MSCGNAISIVEIVSGRDLISGVIVAVITAILTYLVKLIVSWFLDKKNDFSGMWDGQIFDANNKVIKQDVWTFRYNKRKNVLKAKIEGLKTGRDGVRNYKWQSIGRITDNNMYIIYWGLDSKSIKHNGCVLCQPVDNKEGKLVYDGKYIKIDSQTNEFCLTRIVLTKRQIVKK